jgi:hypothetical protein
MLFLHTHPIALRPTLILNARLPVGVLNGFFLLGVPTKVLYTLYFSSLPYILSLILHVILFHGISVLSRSKRVVNDMYLEDVW